MVTTLKFTVDGSDVTENIMRHFDSISITDKKGIDSDSILLNITDHKKNLGEPDSWVKIAVWVNGIDKGLYEISGLSGDIKSGSIEITGTAQETKGNITLARSRSFDPLTVGDLVEKIAGEHGYISAVGKDHADIELGHVNQHKESDANLLTRLAEEHNAIFKFAHGRLFFMDADKGESATGEPLPVLELGDPATTTGRWSAKKRDTVTGTKAGWLDEQTNKVKFVEVGEAPFKEVKQQARSEDQARLLAEAELKQLNKLDRELELEIPLNVDYFAGCKAKISNHGIIDGDWLIESMTHNISTTAYDTTSLKLVKPSS